MNQQLYAQVKSVFGFKRPPFSKEVPPPQAFRNPAFTEALQRLQYLDDRRGVGAVFGAAGSGKSTLLRCFLSELPRTTHHCAYLAHGSGTVTDLYRELCWAFDVSPGFRKSDMARLIKDRILQLSQVRKIRCLLVLDEAHLLPAAFLEELRFLMNFHEDGKDELTLLLAGQPQLEYSLRLACNEAIAQRIFLRIKLTTLNREHVGQYLQHRLQHAGRTAELFTPDAVEAIAKASQGIPRLIDNLAEHALLLALENQHHHIDAGIVTRAIDQACP